PKQKNLKNLWTKPRVKEAQKCTEVVYQIPCSSCDLTYIGTTGLALSERLKRHNYEVNAGISTNSIAKHKQTTSHLPNLDQTIILHSEKYSGIRKQLEKFEITRNSSSILNHTDLDHFQWKKW